MDLIDRSNYISLGIWSMSFDVNISKKAGIFWDIQLFVVVKLHQEFNIKDWSRCNNFLKMLQLNFKRKLVW
jgi:hypothetical protein